MGTASVVSQIKRMNPDWTRAEILSVLNTVHKYIRNVESMDTVYRDPATGTLPYLTTQAAATLVGGTAVGYTMDIPSTIPIFKVEAIVCPETNWGEVSEDNENTSDFAYRRDPIQDGNGTWYPVPTRSTEWLSTDTPCSVTFLFDPGTTTTTYQVYGYKRCNDILTEAAEIEIPARMEPVFTLGVQKYMQGLQYSKLEEALDWINQKVKGPLREIMYHNSHDIAYSTPQEY